MISSIKDVFGKAMIVRVMAASSSIVNAQEIVIDNLDDNYTVRVGEWLTSSQLGFHGIDSLYGSEIGDSFSWDPDISTPGEYEISSWWVPLYNRDTTAVYEVHHVNGVTPITIDQTNMALGEQWNSLGSFSLDQNSFVRIVHDGSAPVTSADAMRFVTVLPPETTLGLVNVIVDNTDENHTEVTGNWPNSGLIGFYGTNSQYTETIGDSFSWYPDLSANGEYEVSARWVPYSNRDTTAVYEVNHVNGVTPVIIDQTNMALGEQWNSLGSFSLDQNSFVRIVHDGSAPVTSADAMRFVTVLPPETTPGLVNVIVDNTDENHTEVTGNWPNSGLIGFYGTNSQYTETIGDSFSWYPDLSANGEYEVSARWVPYSNRDTTAVYEVHHVNGATPVIIDQTNMALGEQWNSLGSFSLDQNSFVRIVHDGSAPVTSADAMRFVTTSTGQVYSFNPGDGDVTIEGSTGQDILRLGEGILLSDVTFIKDNNNLVVITGGNDLIDINDFFISSQTIETLEFSNGLTIDLSAVLNETNFSERPASYFSSNSPPVAVTDYIVTTENETIIIRPLENDFDPDGDSLRLVWAMAADHMGASVEINNDQTITYAPPLDTTGGLTLNYTVFDDNGLGTNGEISLSVLGVETTDIYLTIATYDWSDITGPSSNPLVFNDVKTNAAATFNVSWLEPSQRTDGSCMEHASFPIENMYLLPSYPDAAKGYVFTFYQPMGFSYTERTNKFDLPVMNCAPSGIIDPTCGHDMLRCQNDYVVDLPNLRP